MEKFTFQTKSFKNRQKKFEKGIDRRAGLRYNNRAVSASETPSGQRMILENDTESRRTRTAIFTSRSEEKTVNSRMSFELGSDSF